MNKYQTPARDMDAFIDPVHDAAFANCIKKMADQVCMSAKSLYRRLDGNDAMPLRWEDGVRIFLSVDEESQRRIVQPFLDHLGMVAMPAAKAPENAALLDLVIDHQVSVGHMSSTVKSALADGQIDARERKEIAEAVQAEIDALCKLRGALESVAEPKLARA